LFNLSPDMLESAIEGDLVPHRPHGVVQAPVIAGSVIPTSFHAVGSG